MTYFDPKKDSIGHIFWVYFILFEHFLLNKIFWVYLQLVFKAIKRALSKDQMDNGC